MPPAKFDPVRKPNLQAAAKCGSKFSANRRERRRETAERRKAA